MTARHRGDLPQLGDDLFLTDGGIKDDEGTERLRRYYDPYLALARELGLGFVLESPTWRASPRWADELG
jgi:hypothetical protein